MSSYHFDAAFPAGHFVTDYVAFASRQTDAAHEYHEAVALALLATATPDVRARIKQFPNALRTNLYLALVGSTSKSRKSTAKDIGLDIAERAFPNITLADKSTPEGFAADLAARQRQAAFWCIDEFAALLVQMHKREYLAGLVSLVLELYGRSDHVYKRVKGEVRIQDAHLTIVGCAADTVFDALHTQDVESGLLPRFAVIYPDQKPPRLPFGAMVDDDGAVRNRLVTRLASTAPPRNDDGRWRGNPREAMFSREAFAEIDRFAQEHEDCYEGEMFRRLIPMLMKVAILSAAGESCQMGAGFYITPEHVAPAIKVVSRWARFADAFTRRLGESRIENLVRRASSFVQSKNTAFVARRAVARHLHVDNRTFADVERTMLDRELIELAATEPSRRRCWHWLEFTERAVA